MRVHYEESRIPENGYYSVRYAQYDNQKRWHIPNHYSNTFEVVLYCSIKGSLFLNDTHYELKGNSLLILPPYTVHSFDVFEGCHDYYIIHLFSENFPESIKKSLLPDKPYLADLDEKDALFAKGLLQYITTHSDPELNNQAIDLFSNWCIRYIDRLQPFAPLKKRANPLRFAPLLKHLDKHMLYTMTADEASAICNMSKSHFFSLFRQHFGKTFSDFLTERQITQAKYLLSRSDMTVAEVAQILGFCDSSYFSKVFKASSGTTPRQFRQKH